MFESLEKCLGNKITPLIFINVDPVWEKFRDDPRFVRLIERSFVAEKKDRIALISTDIKEKYRINLNQLIYVEAQENYCKLVWEDDGQLKEKLLRVTLKRIGDQICDNRILRCHRSYIINTSKSFLLSGNSNGYKLKHTLSDKTIPVSRALGKEIV